MLFTFYDIKPSAKKSKTKYVNECSSEVFKVKMFIDP